MSIILFIVFGLVIGLLARAIMPGRQSMSIWMTTLLGMAGSLVGGFLGALVTRRRVLDLNSAGLIGSLIGALILLYIYTRFVARDRPT
jgi:uncharacterized membrane protein YeaQ/YmgE (transglycosylase-associated protein family)